MKKIRKIKAKRIIKAEIKTDQIQDYANPLFCCEPAEDMYPKDGIGFLEYEMRKRDEAD